MGGGGREGGRTTMKKLSGVRGGREEGKRKLGRRGREGRRERGFSVFFPSFSSSTTYRLRSLPGKEEEEEEEGPSKRTLCYKQSSEQYSPLPLSLPLSPPSLFSSNFLWAAAGCSSTDGAFTHSPPPPSCRKRREAMCVSS